MPNQPHVVEDFCEGGQREDDEGAGQQAAAAPAHQPAVVPTGNANIELEESMDGMNNDDKMNMILRTMLSMKEDMALMATKEDMAVVSKNVEKLMVAAPAAALPANTSYVVGNGAVQVGNAVESGGSQTWSIVEQ